VRPLPAAHGKHGLAFHGRHHGGHQASAHPANPDSGCGVTPQESAQCPGVPRHAATVASAAHGARHGGETARVRGAPGSGPHSSAERSSPYNPVPHESAHSRPSHAYAPARTPCCIGAPRVARVPMAEPHFTSHAHEAPHWPPGRRGSHAGMMSHGGRRKPVQLRVISAGSPPLE
jgi:hypothetical protein